MILKIEIKMVITTLAKLMGFVDIMVEEGFKQRSKAISQAQIRRSYIILEAFAVARGMLSKAQKNRICLNDWSICIYLMILSRNSSEKMSRLSIMPWQYVHLELSMDGGAEHLIIK